MINVPYSMVDPRAGYRWPLKLIKVRLPRQKLVSSLGDLSVKSVELEP